MSFYIIDRTLAGTPRSDTARALPAFMNAHFIVGSALKRISLKAMTTRRARSKSKTVRKAANKVTIKKKANLLAKKRSSLSSSTTKSQTATPSNNSSFSSTNSSNKSNSAFKWQYEDGNWGDYDTDASDMVENCYQGWLKRPGDFDVRAVQSGEWNYFVDFRQLKQTNIDHSNHTMRNIRRLAVS